MTTSATVVAEGALDDRVDVVARWLVDAGRVVPGLTVGENGSARSWWWPLPAAQDRSVVASLLDGPTVDDHRRAADALAEAVDREVRERLGVSGVVLAPRRAGRRTVPEAWVQSLTAVDPWLPASLDPHRVQALADAVADWVASGAVVLGQSRLCLRVHEPAAPGTGQRWPVELLVQHRDDPSFLRPLAELWAGVGPFGPHAVEEVLTALGHLARLAPELAGLLDEAAPTGTELDTAGLVDLAATRLDLLADAGIGVLLPAWWTRRRRVGLRAKATTKRASGPAAAASGGLGMDTLVAFTWEAALGEDRLTKADLRSLEHAARSKQGLVQVRGEWVEVGPGEIDAVLRHAGTRAEATAAELLQAGLGLGGSLSVGVGPDPDGTAGVEVTGVVATGWLGDLLDDALHTRVRPVPTPAGFQGALRPYQERGVGWLAFLGRLGLGACLADDMGLGKTAQTIASLLADPAPGPTLVVCPVSVLGNWARELERFAPALTVLAHHGADRHRAHEEPFADRASRHDVVLTTYSLVARDLDHLREVSWGRLVLDEAQQVKNPATAQTRAVQQLGAARRVALTGTPVENHLTELWSLMQVLNPGLLGPVRAFRERFAIPIERDHDADAAARLRRVTGPFVLRRLKTDRSIIDDLPDKIELTERCPLTREQATLYQAVVDHLLERADATEGIERRGQVLAGILRLKQVCNHPAHFLGDRSALPHRSGKLTRVEELLEEILDAGDKVLCFTQFAEWGGMLAPYLARRFGVDVAWLHGGVSRATREQLVASFQAPAGPPVFLLSLKAGGTGLNLTAASHVVHLDRWWNPAVEDQATDRAYRIGQDRTVLVHKLVASGTIEERIDAVITAKRALAERVVGTGEQWLTELSTDELRAVVALRDTEVED